MSISYHDTVKFLQGMIDSAPSPFARPEWFALLEARCAQPVVVAAGEDRAKSALVLENRNGHLHSLVNWYSFSWQPSLSNDPIALRRLAEGLKSKGHRVTMAPVPDEDGSATALEAAFRLEGWHVRREACDHNHVLPVGERSFADYWASRPGPMRTTLKRKAKKVDISILTQWYADSWQAYEAIYAKSWKPEEGDPALLREFAQQEADAGRMRLGIARHDGIPVAAQFWTVENGIAYIHKLAHLEEYKPLSAGTSLSAALFEHVIDTDGVSLIDFGTGNDAYKRDWMELDRPRYRIDCLDPRQPRAWPALAKRLIRALAPAARRG